MVFREKEKAPVKPSAPYFNPQIVESLLRVDARQSLLSTLRFSSPRRRRAGASRRSLLLSVRLAPFLSSSAPSFRAFLLVRDGFP